MDDHNEKTAGTEPVIPAGTEPLPPGYHRHSDGTIHTHTHLEDGSIPPEHMHSHEHGHDHSHGHTHTHTQTKAVLNRLSRAIGHLESVKAMVENGRDCTEVLIQLAAVRSALSSTAKVILKDHMEHCISEDGVDAEEQMRALNEAIDKFM
jgi:DNA-binding FrmR family transcriptional regulator